MVISRALTVEELCNKLRPVYGKKIDEIYFQYTTATTREERDEVAHVLNALYQKNLNQLLDKGVLLEPPRPEQMDGTYEIATVSYAGRNICPFNLREKDWPRHVCITGMSGSGKTTVAFNIVESLIKHNKNFLIFDWKKSFRPLLKFDPTVMIFTVGEDAVCNNFKMNINKPPKGVAPKEWINTLSDLLTESFSASFGVHKVLLETLDEAFKEWGIYNGSDNYPTWNHIKWRLEEKLNKTQGREGGWLESALRIATVLTFGEFGKCLNYKGFSSISVEDILNTRVILELNALGNIEKKFFSEFVLTYIFKLKKAMQNEASHGFDHAILVDEAHNIFLKKPTSFTNESVTDMIYREMREYGTALICLDQHISKISDTVKGNSACNIAFQQQLPQDIEDISGLMQLRESRHFFSQLPVGSAIVKLSERYTSPFLIEVPYSKSREVNVTNDEVIQRMKTSIMKKEMREGSDKKFTKEFEGEKKQESSQEKTKTASEKTKTEENFKNPKEDFSIDNLSEIQKTLYEFVSEYLKSGVEISDIEKILEQSKTQGNYTSSDIAAVIKGASQNPAVVTFKKENSAPIEEKKTDLSSDQQKLIQFLQANPNHKLTSVKVYQETGLGARRGTKAKKELESLGLIKIETEKYEKGWKKYIRLN